ncbi:MAG: Uma2 family endonuclease [Chloroflexota bacterium]
MITVAKPTIPAASPVRPPEQGQWAYEDWLRLPDDGFRYEVLKGELHMAPPPTLQHQRTSGRLFARMQRFTEQNDLGEVFEAPTGVRLPNEPVPVQPDILFVRKERLNILGKEYVEGAPDLIVEILSPSNWTYDRKEKFQAYRDAGVSEYWIVDYRPKTIEVFVLEAGTYALVNQFGPGDTVRSTTLIGFEVKVDDILAS